MEWSYYYFSSEGDGGGDTRDTRGDSVREATASSVFQHRQGCPICDVHPAFSLPPTLKSALKGGFGEAGMPELYLEFSSFDTCQKRFKEVDPAPHSVVGLGHKVGDAEKFLRVLSLESLDLFSQNQQAGSLSRIHRGGRRQQKTYTT